ncbi:hypothetical protein XELAEV_18004652mg [Xenopus laevis]|uniref:G-protein coupled receptors family 3 profile domain-containing protein n=1 Tax=Xenopus laevis TaxID=8355 RepID=A0A974GZI3_XENLA|nr:hypothetical protein XELAEV_18004652mg [Xenopus laevis]
MALNILFRVLIYVVSVRFIGYCHSGCKLKIIKALEDYEYIKEGDIIIGGVITVNAFANHYHSKDELLIMCFQPSIQNYKYLLDFRYYINEFNKNQFLKDNVTLGYHIYDSCGDVFKAERSILQILSGLKDPIPNYSCAGKRNIAGFIGDLTSDTTIPIAHILSTLGYSQVSYGATDPFLSDRNTFPFFFRTVQSDDGQFIVLTQLLKYFGWTWVGIITTNDINGERNHQLLTTYLSSEGICIDFTIKIQLEYKKTLSIFYKNIFQQSSAGVVIVCGTINMITVGNLRELSDISCEKTFIFTSNFLFFSYVLSFALELFNGSLVFAQNKEEYNKIDQSFRQFLAHVHPSIFPDDKLLEVIWMLHHSCIEQNISNNFLYELLYPEHLPNCTGKERLTDIEAFNQEFHTSNMFIAAHALSFASGRMHFMQTLHNKPNSKRNKKVIHFRYQLHHILKDMTFRIHGPFMKYFNIHGELVSSYQVVNVYDQPKQFTAITIVGYYIPWAPLDERLHIALDAIKWKTKNNQIPKAQCSDNCLPGFRKATKPGAPFCCYDCVLCSEGEISNITDSKNCIRCSDMESPNEKRNQCIAKSITFLSYDDVITEFFSFMSLVLVVVTLLILGVCITYWNSSIVRANNRSLSFLLLVSIKLSFLSVFLFLGRPVDITCMLRNITFGITFSIAVSSLLAKTIMVCVAFKATKPGSSWRKWVGVKLSNSVVLFCSSIQIIICMTWLAISPPFQELDFHTYPRTIIIQCNEGSAIGFYSVIGYMGLLAAVSFVLAFLARTLPDSFNEAKYITFSMLLFCSVWITMIPAYLSTKGKNTVCVEIFAILTSSAGLLFCIFLPKCYIILFRPEMNTKSHVVGNKAL